MSVQKRFSERFGYSEPKSSKISVRYEAPEKLRSALPIIASEVGLSPKPMRELVCRVLRERPNSNNWSEYPNINDEVNELIDNCDWYEVYDIIEEAYEVLCESRKTAEAKKFLDTINKFFVKNEIGWQLVDGQIKIRGTDAFEAAVSTAKETLSESGRSTAATEIHEALNDLSRRPNPDLTGAVQHAMAALECVARDVTGDHKATLGNLIKKNPGLLPPPLDQVVEKAWGYASERGRHIQEGQNPKPEEAELIVGLASVIATYLSKSNNQ